MGANRSRTGSARIGQSRGLASLLLLAALAAGCLPRPFVERAIRARGGALDTLVREVESDVHAAFPGTWRWRTAFMAPDRYAWTIFTAGEPNHFLFDGVVVRGFIGSREVSVDRAPDAPLRSHARFTAIAQLDALRLPGVHVQPLADGELPAGVVAGLAVALADDGARYRLGFDREMLLVWVEGPIRLLPLGEGTLTARFGDFRRTGGFLLPFATSYTFGGAALAEERALAVCPNDPRVTIEAFRTPARLSCEPAT